MHAPRVVVIGTVLAAAFVMGCKPDYPSCETDKDCSDKKEFCVAGKCQQCRDNKDCAEGQSCNSGRCDKIPSFCKSAAQCPAGMACVANRCAPCAADKDCPSGTKCWKGTCDNRKHCSKDDDCAQNEDCTAGVCTSGKPKAPPPVDCRLTSVYFDFNESALTTEATSTLNTNAECLKKVKNSITIVGHTDPRGTAEYNIALSERRAQSVQTYLERLGITGGRMAILPRGAIDATGTNEPTWAQDRRADFTWR
ncbi:MAG TPA: OmpA family protein [Polyangia bacterium]